MSIWYRDRWLTWRDCREIGSIESPTSGRVLRYAIAPNGDNVMTSDFQLADDETSLWPVPLRPKKPKVVYDKVAGETTQAGWSYYEQKDEYDCWLAVRRANK